MTCMPSGNILIEHKIRPEIDPCGTPLVSSSKSVISYIQPNNKNLSSVLNADPDFQMIN